MKNEFYILQNRRTRAVVFADCNDYNDISKLCSHNYKIIGKGMSDIDVSLIVEDSAKHYQELYVTEVEKNQQLISVLNNAVKIIGS